MENADEREWEIIFCHLAGGDFSQREHIRGELTLDQLNVWVRYRNLQYVALGVLAEFGGVNVAQLMDTDSAGSTQHPAWLDQGLGDACQGRLIATCQGFFGSQLPTACRTCPGPG